VDPFDIFGAAVCVPATQPAGHREYCGDDVYHVACYRDFHCDHSNQRGADHAGMCLPNTAHLDERCGTLKNTWGEYEIICARGLRCKPPSPFDVVVTTSTCVPLDQKAGYREVCDDAEYHTQCDDGYACEKQGEAGLCLPIQKPPVMRIAELGQACGGFVGIRCAANLVCHKENPRVSDASGICKAKP
jgi:hypothetical protein